MKIGIIGAGFTGLTAGYLLSKKGHEVTIFEHSYNAGGLAGGFEIAGTSIEKAYHHFFASDTKLLELIQELDMGSTVMWLDSSTAIWNGKQYYPFTKALDLLTFSPLTFWDRIRTGLVFVFLKIWKNWKIFDDLSAKEWLIKWNGQQVYNILWKPILKGKFHNFADEISMAWFWARIHSRASSKKNNGEKLGYINGGFQILIDKLVGKISSFGGKVHFNTTVKSIQNSPTKVLLSNNKWHKFDKLFVTVPSYVFSDLAKSWINPKFSKLLSSIDYIGAVVGIIRTDIDINNYYWTNINDSSAPFLAFINHTKLTGTNNYDGSYIYYLGGYYPHSHEYFDMNSEEIEKRWIDYLDKMHPTLEVYKHILEKQFFKFKNAQHIAKKGYLQTVNTIKREYGDVYLSNFSLIYPWDRGVNWAIDEGYKFANKLNT